MTWQPLKSFVLLNTTYGEECAWKQQQLHILFSGKSRPTKSTVWTDSVLLYKYTTCPETLL